MKNERGAGRKAIINNEQIIDIKDRVNKGESISAIAREYGVSRQALYNRLKSSEGNIIDIEYLVDGDVTTRIELDIKNESLRIENIGHRISRYAFGLNMNPNWDDFIALLENQLLMRDSLNDNVTKRFLLQDSPSDKFSLNDILGTSGNVRVINDDKVKHTPKFVFSKKDILYSRSDTDGYQLKALSHDRRYFVKSQASISGLLMNDWAVEIMASDICKQLGIPHVSQNECEFVYGDRVYKGVFSDNFELDGYSFISFERLLERLGTSSKEHEFIHLGALDKMKWCAEKLSIAGDLSYDSTLKYMLDLAIVDCLVGNIDRHTRNFGLFYNSYSGKYEIPLIFDNGMGMFENDGYRDKYSSYEAAMMNVYVAPYGEDPFDMMKLLMDEYDLTSLYPGLKDFEYKSLVNTPYALTYMERMKQIWQK